MDILNNTMKLIGFDNNLNVIFIEYLNASEFLSVKYKNINTMLIFLFKPLVLGEWKFKILSNGIVNFKINNKYLINNKDIDIFEFSISFDESIKNSFTILARKQNFINTKIYFKSPNYNEYRLFTPNNCVNLCKYLSTNDRMNVLNSNLLNCGYYSTVYDYARLKHWKFYEGYLPITNLEEL